MQEITDWLLLTSNIVMVIITTIYVYIMKRVLDTSRRELSLSQTPVIGITIDKIGVSKVFGLNRRNLGVDLSLINIGNAPAIEVLFDGEMILEYSTIEDEKNIPSRYEPGVIPFIKPGEEYESDPPPNLSFGNNCVTHVFDDMRECNRLNTHRIATDPTVEPFNSTRLKIIIYYRNSYSQWFQSNNEVWLYLGEIPEADETAEFRILGIPRQIFFSEPIDTKEKDKLINKRNLKRNLCGW